MEDKWEEEKIVQLLMYKTHNSQSLQMWIDKQIASALFIDVKKAFNHLLQAKLA